MPYTFSLSRPAPSLSFSRLLVATRASLRGAGGGWALWRLGGTEKFRLGAGSQAVCAPASTPTFLAPLPLSFSLFILSLDSRVALPSSVTRCTRRHRLSFITFPFPSSLSPTLFVFSSLSRRNRRRSSRPNSFLYACRNGIDRNLGYRRIAADTHAPRGHPAGTPCVALVYTGCPDPLYGWPTGRPRAEG